MKIEILKEIIKKKSSKEQFAVLTNLTNGNSEIFELGNTLSKEFESYKKEDFYSNFENKVKAAQIEWEQDKEKMNFLYKNKIDPHFN